MCECKDCDNFKAKKREPQVGDRVSTSIYGHGVVVSDNSAYCYLDGSSMKGRYLVFLDGEQHGMRAWNFQYENLTVIE